MKEEKVLQGTRNPNGAGSVYPRKDGRWCGQIQIGVKQDGRPDIKYVYGKTPKEAQKKLDDLKLLYSTSEELKDNIVIDKTYKDMYIDEYFLRWLRDEKFDNLQASSYDTLENTVLNHIIPAIGHFKMNGDVSSELLKDLIVTKPYRRGLSYASVKKIYTATRECFAYAKTFEHIEKNPMEKVDMIPSDKFSNEDEELVIFTDDEIERFKKAIDTKTSKGDYIYKMGYVFIFVLNTGIRSGELLALKWNDIDLENRLVNIKSNHSEALERDENGERIINEDGTSQRYTVRKRTKTRSGRRTIPLNDNAIEALETIKSHRYFGKNSHVFATSNNTPSSKKNAYSMFNRILDRAEIEQCGLHTLRHTFASMQLRNGVDISVVSKLLGHASVSVTYDIYIHIIEEQKIMAVNLTNI